MAAAVHGLANVLVRQGRDVEAEATYRTSIEIKEKAYGTRVRPDLLPTLANFAGLLLAQPGREPDAATATEESYATAKTLWSPFNGGPRRRVARELGRPLP